MRPAIEILVEHPDESRAVIHVRGEIDAHSVQQLDAVFNDLLRDRPLMVVVDLAEVNYVSSSGVMRMITARDQARDLKGDVAVANAPPQVRQVFELLGLDSMLQFAATVQEAWAGMKVG